jgi:hypothetical protein
MPKNEPTPIRLPALNRRTLLGGAALLGAG